MCKKRCPSYRVIILRRSKTFTLNRYYDMINMYIKNIATITETNASADSTKGKKKDEKTNSSNLKLH